MTSCRNCSATVSEVVADLGMSPLANAFLRADELDRMEPFFPLKAMVCAQCLLVQLDKYETPEAIFSDYVYFSSWSTTWVAHAGAFARRAAAGLRLGPHSRVVELASNDGYLLQHFIELGIPVLGVEPAANVAQVASDRGIPTVVEFFGAEVGERLAKERPADLIVANNVLAHVPALHDFVAGMKALLAADGTISIEVPHLLTLVAQCQFDTIYHEHFSYFSLLTVERVLGRHDLVVEDVEELSTHGGSLRIWARHAECNGGRRSERVDEVMRRERETGLDDLTTYRNFARRVVEDKHDILTTLIGLKREGLTIAGYGAPAKGNTLLNYCGIRTDLVEFTVDISPHKQGLFTPGAHIPVHHPDEIRHARPDILFILPWNLQGEVTESMSFIREWGGRFLVRRPELSLIA